jgi:hypothetical protein
MSKYTVRFRAPIAVGAILLLAACGGDANDADSALAADSALNSDLALAGADTAAQPALRDVPAAPRTTAPSTTTPRTTTPAPTKTTPPPSGNKTGGGGGGGGTVHTVPAGTALALRANNEVCTNTSHVGDTFTATTTAPVSAGGARIPTGAVVTMKVTQLKRSENVTDKIIMAFEVVSVKWGNKSYPLSGNITQVAIDRVRNQPKSADVKKVVGGAAIGAIAGQVLGKSTKSTVIGAAAGAAAGAGAAVATANYEGCIRSGSAMTVTLTQPLQVVASAQRQHEHVHHRKVA